MKNSASIKSIGQSDKFKYFWKQKEDAKYFWSIYDGRLGKILDPITEDLVEMSKGHQVSIAAIAGERRGKFPKVNGISITLHSELVKSKNPIISLFYKLLKKKHVSVEKEVITEYITKDDGIVLFKSPKNIIRDVKKTLAQAVLEHEKFTEYDRLCNVRTLIKSLTSRVKKLSSK